MRDQVLAAIDGAVLGDVEDGLDLYGRLLASVLELRDRYSQLAEIEPPPTWFNEHGREAEWLEDDLRTFIERAWRVGNEDVLREIAARLTRFLEALRQARQPGAHRRVLRLAATFYWRALARDQPVEKASIGRSMLISVRSYGEYQVLGDFSARPSQELVYAGQVVTFLADAVHVALDFYPDGAPGAVIELRELVESLSLRQRGRDLSDLPAEYQQLRDLAAGYALGLAAYVLMLRSKESIRDDEARRALHELQLVLSEASTWDALLAALQDERPQPYPWSQWEMQHWPDGVRGGAVGELEEWIRYAAVLELARQNNAHDARTALQALPPHTAAHVLNRLLRAHTSKDAPWVSDVIPGAPNEAQLKQVKDELTTAVGEYERQEADVRAELPIEPEKLSAFVRAVEREWLDPHALRGSLGSVEPSETAPKSWFGYNSLQSRDFFTSSPHVHAPAERLGQSIGRGIVRGEITRIVEVLDQLPHSTSTLSDLKSRVDRIIDDMKSADQHPRILIIGDWRAAHALTGDYSFGVGQSATYRDCPLDLEYVDRSPICFVFDERRTLEIRRWRASATSANDMIAADGKLLISVREIDDRYATELLAENPALASHRDEDDQSEESPGARLRQLVHVRVWTKLEIALGSEAAGHAIDLAEQS